MSDYFKYGLITLIGWNIFVVLLAVIASYIKEVSCWAMFDDGTNGIAMSIFLIVWSLIWFGIGYTSRKKFVLQKEIYKEKVPLLNDESFNKAFRNYYISKNAKMLSIILITAIPWYILGYVRGSFSIKDWIIVSAIMTLSLIAFGVYKIKRV